ncbi:MAG TPA: chemotaxis protein CheV [Acidiferrobacterales bacterium]|nr:chemotaxis protein CheV [Acidiferrobacterales bacterium]
MAGVLDSVNARTRMAGNNRLELLLFRMQGRQRYGINVFKVREVIECPPLRRVPTSHPAIRGVATIRGRTLSVIDLGKMLGMRATTDMTGQYVVITEFNRSIQGFLVGVVDRIVNMNWEDILAPPANSGKGSYLTAVTRLGNELVEILDVEKVLAEVVPRSVEVSEEVAAKKKTGDKHLPLLVVDDSSTARKMIARTLDQIGIPYIMAVNGREALAQLHDLAADGQPVSGKLGLVISDIEMPEMDGYTLTTEIKKDPRLKDLYVLLHSSLSGVFNDAMVKQVGADQFLAKFNSDDFARLILEIIAKTRTAGAASPG